MTDYREVAALNVGGINTYLDDGPHYYWPESPFNPNRITSHNNTEEMIFGSACHKLTFERDVFHKEYIVIPPFNNRSNAGKQEYAEFLEAHPNKQPLTQKTYKHIVQCVDALWANTDIKKILKDAKFEQEYYWERDELPCKGKIDIVKDIHLLDYKVMHSSKESDFKKAVMERGYHRQDFWYSDGFFRTHGEKANFGFIVQDKNNPHAIGLFCLEDFVKQKAEEEACRAADEIAKRLSNGNWNRFEPIGFPKWHKGEKNV